jgi:RND family efflux transporter MFP subunit
MGQTPPDLGGGVRPPYQAGDPADTPVFDLNQDLWQQFAEAASPKSFCQSWLSLQCRMLKNVRSALVLLGNPDRGPFTPAAVWPYADFNVKHLTAAAERALRERRGLLLKSGSSPSPENTLLESYHIGYPIEVAEKVHGVVVLEVILRSPEEVQAIMRQLHWGAAWLEVILRRVEAQKAADSNERLRMVIDLLVSVVEQDRFRPGAMALVTRMATELGCDRVSLGFEERGKLRVKALSHSAEFGRHMNLVRAIESAMDEAMDQHAAIVYPLPEDAAPLVTRAHADLVRLHGAGAILTVPIKSEGRLLGGLTLERPADRPFEPETVELCESVATLVGPVLNTKRREERWLITKGAESAAGQLKKFIGPGHLTLKLVTLLLLALTAFFYFAKGEFRITAPVSLEGTIQRAICAPFNGYIMEARVRPGDVIQEGELLCLMDDRDLKLERLKWVTQREQLTQQYHEAMAKHDRSQVQINRAKIEQAEAQIGLLDEQLIRTKVTAPFAGVIMKGDLSQSLGSPVERGQVLFEVAPLDSYRVIIQVDERDMDFIRVDQRGKLMLPSMPGEVFPLQVQKITPVSIAKEGRNYFRVEARLENTPDRLRPGMEGISKVNIDERRYIWIWTRELIQWVYLKLWSWWP